MRRWLKLLLIFVAVAGLMSTVGGVVVFKTTSQSNFCNQCHIMEPYYQSWQRGPHAKVECTACHMPPGLKGKVLTKFQALTELTKYVTKTWGTKPWGHVTDASCLECHDLAKLQGEAARPFGKGLRFKHGPHLADAVRHKHLACTTCHAQVERSVHMQIATQACYICHFKPEASGQMGKQAQCTTCHIPEQVHRQGRFAIPRSAVVARASSPDADCASCHRKVVDGEGDVPRYRCKQCHADQGVMKSYDRTEELHRVHVTNAGAECFNCSTEITHRRPPRPVAEAALDCLQCHGSAHEAQIRLFTGQLLPGGTPSGMHRAGLQCSSCHVTATGSGRPRLELKPSACGRCHDAKLSARALLWSEGAAQLADGLRGQLALLKTTASGAAGAKLADELSDNLQTLKGAHAVHNLPHARAVLDDVHSRLRAALPARELARVSPLPHQRWEAQGRCVDWHFASLAIPGTYKGRTFSHEAHRSKLAQARCDACHDDRAPAPHGALKEPNACRTCHHAPPQPPAPGTPRGTKAPECGSCHAPEKQYFAGKLPELGLEVAPIWSNKSCKDCHGREAGKADAPELWSSCASCHDEGFDTAMKQKLSGYAARRARIMTQATPPPSVPAERARALGRLLDSDRSGGAHHPALTEKVLDILEGRAP